ncbi:DoxX family protein [Catalinimonas niigatensis]|uniref:DoxX family protein n=1 Tax=Catalinimonas niigatensis TaxID=1397264 RepID=UPI0026651BED|nr:DoxX family protein [Catalinimonas niigatensis]WPP48314.1 DoxX family protein [Catalinimonas niigatensis]
MSLLSSNASKGLNPHLGLLILRIGIGMMFITHGAPKLWGGPEYWEAIGENMKYLGITFAPVFWGFMAGFAEAVGGLCLILGILYIPACLLLCITMIVASISHLAGGEGIGVASHAIEAAILFLSLIFIGSGKYRIGK